MAKKPKGYKDGGDIIVTGQRPQDGATFGGYRLPVSMGTQTMSRSGYGSSGGGSSSRYTPQPSSPVSVGKLYSPVGAVYGVRGIPVGAGTLALGASPRGGGRLGGSLSMPFKKGGSVKKMAKGGSVSSASKPADGCTTKGKTKGRFV